MDTGLYIHVPFCTTRCGYCDFNTYTPGEDGTSSVGTYLNALEAELDQAAAEWDRPGPPSTVFLGGGTPSLLGADGLTRVLGAVRRSLGLAPGAEVTTESNPESTSPEFFSALLEAGYTRISLGMQSASAHVLKVLERNHTPGRATAAAQEALAAGFDHVNLDLIYGTPTETDDDLRRSIDAALSTGVDHISAYSLIVEDGTAMARKVRKGQLPAPEGRLRRPLRDDRRGPAGRRHGLVRGLQLVEAGRGVPPQPRLLAWRAVVGCRPRRPRLCAAAR